MKFSCESCQAQYMISDEKVGPAGVRVRCKKCQHINLIKPLSFGAPAEAAPAPVSAATEPTAGESTSPALKGSSPGLDIPKDLEEEIGNALDSVFTETPAPASTTLPATDGAPGGLMSAGSQLGSTPMPGAQRISGTHPSVRTSQPGVANPVVSTTSVPVASSEWYVAINDEQVGPLRPEEVKARWERGEIGADTLVWCGRMPDWRPLSAVEDLARLVVPIRSQPTPLPRTAGTNPSAPLPNDDEPGLGFKPSAASAMASLASMAQEEISAADRSRKISQPVKAAGPATAGLLAYLPGPADTAGAQRAAPALDHFEDSARAGTPRVTRESYEAPRSSRGGLRWVALTLAVALVSVGAAGAAYWFLLKPRLEPSGPPHDEASALLARKEPPPPAPIPPAPPVPVPAVETVPNAHPPTPAAGGPPASAKEVAAAKTPAAATPLAHAATPKTGTVPAEDRRHKRDRAHPPGAEEHPRAVAVAGTPGGGSGEDFLNGAGESSLDKEFAKELEGGGEGATRTGSKQHSVYIPPPPGQGELPQVLKQSDIMETVVLHKGLFAKCVQEQKRRDPSSTGTIVMRWKIRPDGHTADVGSKGGDYQDSPLAGCLKGQITHLKFGGYRGPQMAPIDFPFNF